MKLLGGGGLQLQCGRLQVHLSQQHQGQVLAATAPDIQLGTRATPVSTAFHDRHHWDVRAGFVFLVHIL